MIAAGRPMELRDIPLPHAAPGWVVLRVEAAGLCHSDLHILDGSLTHTMSTEEGELLTTTAPITLGHEIAGTIFELGDGVPSRFAVGDRVISGGPMIPRAAPGLTIDGGFAEYVTVPHEKLQFIPDGVGFDEAAVSTDSIATSYSAVEPPMRRQRRRNRRDHRTGRSRSQRCADSSVARQHCLRRRHQPVNIRGSTRGWSHRLLHRGRGVA